MAQRTVRVVSAEIQQDGRYLLTQRLPTAVLPGLWEFPGGRVRDGEDDRDALRRTLADRIGVDAHVDEKLLEVQHDYDDWSVVMAVYRCDLEAPPAARRVAALAWVEAGDFGSYPFPGADQKTLQLLLSDASDESA